MKRQVAKISMAAGLFVALGLAGCKDRRVEDEVRSVDWYQVNNAERAAKLTQCMSDPREYDATPNCINASRAENNVKADTKWGTKSEGVRTPASIND